jgi:uncharacterized membrane protein
VLAVQVVLEAARAALEAVLEDGLAAMVAMATPAVETSHRARASTMYPTACIARSQCRRGQGTACQSQRAS